MVQCISEQAAMIGSSKKINDRMAELKAVFLNTPRHPTFLLK